MSHEPTKISLNKADRQRCIIVSWQRADHTNSYADPTPGLDIVDDHMLAGRQIAIDACAGWSQAVATPRILGKPVAVVLSLHGAEAPDLECLRDLRTTICGSWPCQPPAGGLTCMTGGMVTHP
jgi:hypothetical protein